mmetsp:Transcript_4302/g.8630  ORF Transcript_4302/g.8630 Transcript_4302/m.8630 type:complete len:369 (-) Transcript_4302:386-1492(-)
MLLYLLRIIRAAESLSRLPFEQGLDKVLGVRTNVLGKSKLALQNLEIHFLLVTGVERRKTRKHFIDQNTKAPPVYWLSVPLVHQDFRRHVLRSATKCVCGVGVRNLLLAQSKVCYLNVTICSKQNIFRLQISVHDVHFVQIAQRYQHFCSVQLGPLLLKPLLPLQVRKQLSAIHEVQNHVQLIFGLESVVKFDDKGMAETLKNISFCFCVFYLISRPDGVLPEHLHSKDFLVVLLHHLQHLAETSLTDHTEQLKVINGDSFLISMDGCEPLFEVLFLISVQEESSIARVKDTERVLFSCLLGGRSNSALRQINHTTRVILALTFEVVNFSFFQNKKPLLPASDVVPLLHKKPLHLRVGNSFDAMMGNA